MPTGTVIAVQEVRLYLYELALELDEHSTNLAERARGAGLAGANPGTLLTAPQASALRSGHPVPPTPGIDEAAPRPAPAPTPGALSWRAPAGEAAQAPPPPPPPPLGAAVDDAMPDPMGPSSLPPPPGARVGPGPRPGDAPSPTPMPSPPGPPAGTAPGSTAEPRRGPRPLQVALIAVVAVVAVGLIGLGAASLGRRTPPPQPQDVAATTAPSSAQGDRGSSDGSRFCAAARIVTKVQRTLAGAGAWDVLRTRILEERERWISALGVLSEVAPVRWRPAIEDFEKTTAVRLRALTPEMDAATFRSLPTGIADVGAATLGTNAAIDANCS